MNTALLARLAALPGYSAARLPAPTEPVLDDLTRQLGEAEAYDLWLGVLFARVATALPADNEALSEWLNKAGDTIRSRRAGAAAQAIERRLPDWLLAIRAVTATLPAPQPLPVGPDAPVPAYTDVPLPRLLEELITWFLKVNWTLYCFLPDQGKAIAAALADELPAVLRRDGLYGGTGGYPVLQKAPRTPQRLAALVGEALGPYPARARARRAVLRWAHQALHQESPAGLQPFAKALAKAAPTWTDAAFDLLLREAVLYVEVEDAQTGKYVKQLAPALFFSAAARPPGRAGGPARPGPPHPRGRPAGRAAARHRAPRAAARAAPRRPPMPSSSTTLCCTWASSARSCTSRSCWAPGSTCGRLPKPTPAAKSTWRQRATPPFRKPWPTSPKFPSPPPCWAR
ncbi:hypothetical protein GCM10027422_27560 [Hymenobacter arcticus]